MRLFSFFITLFPHNHHAQSADLMCLFKSLLDISILELTGKGKGYPKGKGKGYWKGKGKGKGKPHDDTLPISVIYDVLMDFQQVPTNPTFTDLANLPVVTEDYVEIVFSTFFAPPVLFADVAAQVTSFTPLGNVGMQFEFLFFPGSATPPPFRADLVAALNDPNYIAYLAINLNPGNAFGLASAVIVV